MNQLSVHKEFSLYEALGVALNPYPSKKVQPQADRITLNIDEGHLAEMIVDEIIDNWSRTWNQNGMIDRLMTVDGIGIDVQAEYRIFFEYDPGYGEVKAYGFRLDNDQLFWIDGEPVTWNRDVMDQVYESVEEIITDRLSE